MGDCYAYTSRAFEQLVRLDAFVGGRLRYLREGNPTDGLTGVLAWGRKPSARRSEKWARRLGVPLIQLEDGFLRSFGTGDRFPPLALALDGVGIYYDSTCASALELLLESGADVLKCSQGDALIARAALLASRLSKYNHAPALRPERLRAGDCRRVLVIDQTAGDLSVSLGGASAESFAAMLAAACAENPDATI